MASQGKPRHLMTSSALLWGLQFAFLSPVLALLLTALYGATPADIGWVLAVYNAGGFVATLIIPGWADRTGGYLRAMLGCAVLTVALAIALAFATSLPLAVIALLVFGGPAGVGSTLLFAELRRTGAPVSTVMQTRAIVSIAWVAGPPAATLIMGVFGDRAILPVLAAIGALNVATTAVMLSSARRRPDPAPAPASAESERQPMRMDVVVGVMVAFILLQATNAVVTSIMTLYVVDELGQAVVWGGIVLGVAALLEVPAFWLIARLSRRFSTNALLVSGCIAGIAYYLGLVVARDPIALIALQIPNAWFFSVVAGIGITLFQDIIPRPGLATGLNMNTRRIGAILSGPIIAIASVEGFGFPGVFAACAALTGIALAIITFVRVRSGGLGSSPAPHRT